MRVCLTLSSSKKHQLLMTSLQCVFSSHSTANQSRWKRMSCLQGPTVSFLWLRVGCAPVTEPGFIRHLRGTSTQDVIAGIKVLGRWVCHWRRAVGRPPRHHRLKRGEIREINQQDPWGNVWCRAPETAVKLTSASVFDRWTLFVSQTSCSFCLSSDRVSCTDFRDVSTEGESEQRCGFV